MLHLDGLALLAAGIVAYGLMDGRWWFFAVLLLAPDLFMLGYLAGPRVGAAVYNAGHTLLIPTAMILIGVLTSTQLLLEIGIIWAAHLGMDHMFGYGFKYGTRFKDTHFGRL